MKRCGDMRGLLNSQPMHLVQVNPAGGNGVENKTGK